VHTEEDRLYLLVAIDRTSRFAFVQLHEKATRPVAAYFPWALIALVAYKVYTALTDNGAHFTSPGNTSSAGRLIKEAIARGEIFRAHFFDFACAQNEIDHWLTKARHPRTNGRVEGMNPALKDATVGCWDDCHNQLKRHLDDFLTAYNFDGHLKTLRGLALYMYMCKS
jgi:transposase InsO family protein